MKLIEYIKSLFRRETDNQRALRKLREALCFLYSPIVNDIRDAELMEWIGHYPPGTGTKAAPVNYVPSYIKVEPAEETTPVEVQEAPSFESLVEILTERFPISDVELTKVYERCGKDVKKLTNTLKLMEFTYKTDKDVLAEYDFLVKQYGNKLK